MANQAYQVVHVHTDARVALARHGLVVGVAGVRLVELVELNFPIVVRGRIICAQLEEQCVAQQSRSKCRAVMVLA